MEFSDGFTGFFGSAQSPLPSVDPAVFKSMCFAAARALGGHIVDFEFAGVTPNFHCATIEWGYATARVSVLCNRQCYTVGFCRPHDGYDIEYLDSPELANALGRVCDWQILSKAELETVVDESILSQMSEFDRNVIETARHKRWFGANRTVGDVMFHYWD